MNYTIWITTKCNLRCKYCYENYDNTLRENLSLNVAEKIINLFKIQNYKIESITFHGGEPLLNIEILKYLTKELVNINKDVRLGFTTNGMNWNEDIRDFLIEYKKNFEHGISVSIDGNRDVHNKNRITQNGEGSYDIMLNTLNNFKNIFSNIRARMTVTSHTIDSMYDSVVNIHSLGINTIAHAFDFYDKGWDNHSIEIMEKEYEKIFKYWEKNKDVDISFLYELRYRKSVGKCELSPNIYVDGNIYPCIHSVGDNDYIIGNIKEGIDNEFADFLKNKVLCNDNEFCKDCTNKAMCIHNRCKFRNKAITGNLFIPAGIGCAIEQVKVNMLNKYKFLFYNE